MKLNPCALRSPEGICALFKEPCDENCNCPRHINQASHSPCCICGNIEPKPVLAQHNDEWKTYCRKCSLAIGLCATCSFQRFCDFQTNPSPIPPTIRKTIRQGNTIIQQDVINPERIAETCKKNCKCFSEEFGCMKQNYNFCDSWKEIGEN